MTSTTTPHGGCFWEGEPMETTIAALDERGISSVVFSPSANVPPEGDWMTVMTENAEALETIAAAHRSHR